MTFQSPPLLWGLLFVPLAIASYVVYERRRAGYADRWASPLMLHNAASAVPGWRRHIPPVLLLLTLVALLVALARPEAALSVPRERATVVLVMDASRSMRSTDVAPQRLVAARRAAETLIDRLPPSFRIAVVGFARRAQTLTAPTTDRVAVRRALGSLELEAGTAIGSGLARGLDLTKAGPGGTAGQEVGRLGGTAQKRPPTVLLLLSDGNNTTGIEPSSAARRARKLGVAVHTVGLGAPADVASPGEPRPPNFDALRTIAGATHGTFSAAPTAEGLETVYEDLGTQIGTVLERREITAAFVGAGALLLTAAGALSLLWFKGAP